MSRVLIGSYTPTVGKEMLNKEDLDKWRAKGYELRKVKGSKTKLVLVKVTET